MTWKCPDCGVEGLDDALTSHAIADGGCGYSKFPAGVTLTSEATGQQITLRISTTLGQSSLKSLDPAEIRFVSSDQFRIEKDPARGGWVLFNVAYATNPLFINGASIPVEGAVLKTGDRLSIKDKYFRLAVQLLG